EVFAEVEHAPVEVKKIGGAVLLAPVAEFGFAAIETVGVLDDHQRQEAAAERAVDFVVNDDRWSGFFQSCGLVSHRLIGPNALAATHLLFNHAADIVLRRLRLLSAAAFLLFRRRRPLSGN